MIFLWTLLQYIFFKNIYWIFNFMGKKIMCNKLITNVMNKRGFFFQTRMWKWTCSTTASASPKRRLMWRNARWILFSTSPSSTTCPLTCCLTSLSNFWLWTLTALLRTRPWGVWCWEHTVPALLVPPIGRRCAKTHAGKSPSGTTLSSIEVSPVC